MPDSRFSAYLQLMRLDRPIGTFLLLWPTLWALWLAGNGQPDPTIVLIFILGTVIMRAAGCVINDFADRKFDAHVSRTRKRPLADGRLTVWEALGLFVLLMLVALLLVMQLNRLTIYLSVIGAILAVCYPFSKRVTDFPQLVLGLAFSMGIPMAYAALTGTVPIEAWTLFIANFLWIVAYDTQYAMADRDEDLIIGIKSTAILFGRFDNLIVGLLHGSALIILLGIGWQRGFDWHYYLGLLLAAVLALYQQYICRDRESEMCLRAFLNNNWFGGAVYCGLVLGFFSLGAG